MRRTCTMCGIEKDLTEFYLWRHGKNPRRRRVPACKSCTRKRTRAYAKKNHARLALYGRAWRRANPDRVRKKRAQERKRQHSTLNRYLVLCARRKRNECKQRGEPCDFTNDCLIAQFTKQAGKCALTGRPLQWKIRRGLDTLSIDRIDPRRGYMMDNIRLVTLQANTARWSARDRELIAFAADVMRIAEHSPYGDGSATPARQLSLAEIFAHIVCTLKDAGVKVTLERTDGPPDELRVALDGRKKKRCPN